MRLRRRAGRHAQLRHLRRVVAVRAPLRVAVGVLALVGALVGTVVITIVVFWHYILGAGVLGLAYKVLTRKAP